MSRLDTSALNEYSRKFADLLFAAYPEWVSLAEAITDPETQQAYLQVVVSVPREADIKDDFYILTVNDEITIGFGEIHWHRNPWMMEDSGPYSEEWTEYQAALEDIEQLLTEEKVLYSLQRGGASVGGGYERRSTLPSLRAELLERFIKSWNPAPRTVVRIRSWRGSLNTDFCVL